MPRRQVADLIFMGVRKKNVRPPSRAAFGHIPDLKSFNFFQLCSKVKQYFFRLKGEFIH